MTTLHSLVLVAHVLIGAMIIGLVLLQRGKGAETGAAFGAGASGTVFGAKGSANFLSRSTAALATLFFATSLSLAYLGSQRPVAKSVVEQTPTAATEPAPLQEQAGTKVDTQTPTVPAQTGPGVPAAGPGSSTPRDSGSPAR
jgi:preprotein translocase subunit SecG